MIRNKKESFKNTETNIKDYKREGINFKTMFRISSFFSVRLLIQLLIFVIVLRNNFYFLSSL